jgi:tripartite-type tricarboxylate transporter receptor subunit TctC
VPIVEAVNRTVNASLRDAAVRQALEALGIQPVGSTPDAFAQRINEDMERFGESVRRVGIRVEG